MMPLLGGSGITLITHYFGFARAKLLSRVRAPEAAEAAAEAVPGMYPMPG